MRWRIWLLSLGITLGCVLIFALASTQVYYRSSVDDSKRYLRVYMNAYNDSFAPDREGAQAFSAQLNGARVTFMDSAGNVLADSMAEEDMQSHADRKEVYAAITTGEGFAVRSSHTLGKSMVYYCKRFESGLVRIAVFTNSDWRIFAETLPTLVPFATVLVALSVVSALVSSYIVLDPVKKLAQAAARGTDAKVETKYSELRPVAALFNDRNRNIRRQMEEIRAEKELAEKARISKDEFISNVTHEMNTPLTSIHGYAELLQSGAMNEAQRETAYKTILAQSERLTNLIACIIHYSEIDSDGLPSYEVNFSALAKETLCALQPEARKKNVRIIERIDENVTVCSRHERVSELFGNLVRNAIKYNREGGTVTVTLTEKLLAVEDTGVGIAPENLDKVFSRFFTVDKSHGGKNGGFGLGLAVVKKICRKEGWDLRLESTPNEGSTFTVRFCNA